jgi:nucleoid-associated protein YgaU
VDRRKKILLAFGVVTLGVVLALQFRKSDFIKSHFSSAPAGHDELAQTSTTGLAENVSQHQSAPLPGTTGFEGHLEAAPGLTATQTQNMNSSNGAATSDASLSNSAAGNPGPLVDLNVPEQTHTIVDGDTLQSLSQQYLGRADRYLELFQYNRDVLRNPDVLPIGAELRIPSHVALPPVTSPPALSSAPANATAPLAPLPPLSTASPQLTSKSTLPTGSQRTAAAQRPAQRTYTVQAGDNLVDLARKFYGDGRRYENLFEANRRVMHNPTDLKPGMVLVIP